MAHYDIFISYSEADYWTVSSLIDRLWNAIPSIKIFYDTKGDGMGYDSSVICRAIDGSDTVLFVVSENSLANKGCEKEILYAKNTGKRIVPYLLNGMSLKGWLLYELGHVNCVQSNNPGAVAEMIRELMRIKECGGIYNYNSSNSNAQNVQNSQNYNLRENIQIEEPEEEEEEIDEDAPKPGTIEADLEFDPKTGEFKQKSRSSTASKSTSNRSKGNLDTRRNSASSFYSDFMARASSNNSRNSANNRESNSTTNSRNSSSGNNSYTSYNTRNTRNNSASVTTNTYNTPNSSNSQYGNYDQRYGSGTGFGQGYGMPNPVNSGISVINGHQGVDLGLPSRLKWATTNIGALNPEDYGVCYAWGEVQPKSLYLPHNCQTFDKPSYMLRFKGVINSDGNLTPAYDAATLIWGGSWHMPTKRDIEELIRYTFCQWTSVNGVAGTLVRSRVNPNSIFLPAWGWYLFDRNTRITGCGAFWSATIDASGRLFAEYLCNNNVGLEIRQNCRYIGFPIRPVSF